MRRTEIVEARTFKFTVMKISLKLLLDWEKLEKSKISFDTNLIKLHFLKYFKFQLIT